MGYKKSFNLITIQLIIPLSTMTKEEYKATYGIDLDDIDIERVTLLQDEESKNKYFVDEIKTTENGVDIYAGGKILSIGSSVSVVNNAYSVENAKPIYCHPILLYSPNTKYRIQFLLFNNESEKFTSATDVFSYLTSALKNSYIMANGLWNGKQICYLFVDESSINVSVYDDSTTSGISDVTISSFDDAGNVIDGVNKIN